MNYTEILDLKEYVVGEGKDDSKYELYCFVIHLDNHYVSLIKNGGIWILYNDENLYRNSFRQSRNTYLLFYKKIG